MNQLYPLKFKPIFKDKIWGGSKLKNKLNKKNASDETGESWEISGVEGDISVVSVGFLKGNNLSELIEIYMGDLIGQKVFDKFGTNFPLLIKYIDASDDLSIQVHPDDKVAAARHNSFGKTEMWYVIQADENSKLICGFNQTVDKEAYQNKLSENGLLDILNNEPVEAGDVFFMPAGRIHAIGKGCLVAEIQQTSDITYRVYDYDRRDKDGNSRELHTELALDVIDFSHLEQCKTAYAHAFNTPSNLVTCNYFTTNILEFDDIIERDMVEFDSFVIYLCLDGAVEILQENEESTPLIKGETVLVPAEITQYYLRANKKSKLLEVYIGNTEDEN